MNLLALVVVLVNVIGTPPSTNVIPNYREKYRSYRIYKRVLKKAALQDSITLYSDSAYYYWDLKNYQKAISYFKKVISFKPIASYYYLDYGYLLLEAGKQKEALKVFENLEKKYPFNEELLLVLYDLYDEMGNYSKKRDVAARLVQITENDSIRRMASMTLNTISPYPVAIYNNISIYWGVYYTFRDNLVDSDSRINFYFGKIFQSIQPLVGVRLLTDTRSYMKDIYEDNHIFVYSGLFTTFKYILSFYFCYGLFQRFRIVKPEMSGINYQFLGIFSKDWEYPFKDISFIIRLYSELNYEKRLNYNVISTSEINAGIEKKLFNYTFVDMLFYRFMRDTKKIYYNNAYEVGAKFNVVYKNWFVIFSHLLYGKYAGIESGEPNPYNKDYYLDARIGFYISF